VEKGGADDVRSLTGQLPPPPPPVRYFNMQGECWKTPDRFPFHTADNARRLYLRCVPPLPGRVGSSGRRQAGGLVERTPAEEARVTLPVDTKRSVSALARCMSG
jgi:predicted acyl esterase